MQSKTKNNNKTKFISVRITNKQYKQLNNMAKKNKLSLSDFVRLSLVDDIW